MLSVRLYLAQRITALIMAPLVIGHIAVMIYAVQGGLTAEEILSRTSGSVGWALFYGTFAVAAAVHAAIGLRAIAYEHLKLQGPALEAAMWGVGATLAGFGLFSVYAVVSA